MSATILARRNQPAAFAAWEASASFASGARHPIYGGFGRRYYPAGFGAACKDLSLAVLCEDEPVLLLCCNLLDGTLGYFGMPMIPVWSEAGADVNRSQALSCALA